MLYRTEMNNIGNAVVNCNRRCNNPSIMMQLHYYITIIAIFIKSSIFSHIYFTLSVDYGAGIFPNPFARSKDCGFIC